MKTWRYHPTNGAKVFDTDSCDMQELAESGWCESPAEFAGTESVIDPDDSDTGDMLEQFNADPEKLNKDQHVKLAETMGLKLTRNMKEATMIEKIKEHMSNGDN